MEKKREPLRCRSVAEADSTSWREVAGLNEIIDVGCYVVQLKNGAGNDELPLPPCDQEHYVVGTLIVTESGTEKLQKNRVIGQTLILSQCNDGQTGIYYRSQAPVDGEQVWSEWNALLSTGQFNEIADGNTYITLDVKDNSVTAQKLSADVRKKVDSPLRPLYIAAGAEYNDSGADKTKTAPWGESVTHKAGHYYLNGLGDITEEQMMDIYIYSNHYVLSNNISNFFFQSRIRTNICKKGIGWRTGSGVTNATLSFYNSSVEIAVVANPDWSIDDTYCFQAGNLDAMFATCKKLKRILGVINISTNTTNAQFMVTKSPMLISLRIKGLRSDVELGYTAHIDEDSVFYMIKNASPTSVITITLHPDAYARLADDADIVAALEAQPLVSLVSA